MGKHKRKVETKSVSDVAKVWEEQALTGVPRGIKTAAKPDTATKWSKRFCKFADLNDTDCKEKYGDSATKYHSKMASAEKRLPTIIAKITAERYEKGVKHQQT